MFKKFETLVCRIDTTYVDCILMGDTNCDFIRPNKGTKHLKHLFDAFRLTQTLDEPTRTTQDTKTLMEHVTTNRPELASEGGVIPCGISDLMISSSCTLSEKQNFQPKKLLQQEILKILTKYNLGRRWVIFYLILSGMYPLM